MAVTGGLLFLLAATTDAPMGAVRWIPPPMHRALDVAVIAALVAAPILSRSTEPLAWALCFLAAAALAWLNWHTDWSRRSGRAAVPTAEPGPAPGPEPGLGASDVPGAPPAPSKAAALGGSDRSLGKTVDRTTRGASRAAGRIYGRARAQRPEKGEKHDPNA
jgi:hypothetical protein